MSGMRKVQATGYELGHIEGWRDASQLVLVGPARPVFTPNVQVQHQALPEATFEEYMQVQREELAQLPGFRLLGSGERVLAGRPAAGYSFSWDLPEHAAGTRIRQQQLVAQRDGEVVTITCSALESEWDQAEPAFELMLSGFAWR